MLRYITGVLALMTMGCEANIVPADYEADGMGGPGIGLTLPFHSGEYWNLTQGYGSNDEDYRGSHRDYGYTYVDDTYALDFAQAGCESYGKEVTPMADGTVMAVYEGGGYGNNVMIDHGDGYVSRYAHMSDVLVSEGEDLKTSDTIGLVGNTGNVYGTACEDHPGTHLHVAFYWNEEATKPEPLSGVYELDVGCWYNREGDKNCDGNPGDYEPGYEDVEEATDTATEDGNSDEIDGDGDLEVAFMGISPEEGTADETRFIWVATVVSPDGKPNTTLFIKNPNDGQTYDFPMETNSKESPYVFTYQKTLNDDNSTYTYWVEAEDSGDSDKSGKEEITADNGHGNEPVFGSFSRSPSSGSAGETEFKWTAGGDSDSDVEVQLCIVNPNEPMIYTFDMEVEWSDSRDWFEAEYEKMLRDPTVYTYWMVAKNDNSTNAGDVMSVEVE